MIAFEEVRKQIEEAKGSKREDGLGIALPMGEIVAIACTRSGCATKTNLQFDQASMPWRGIGGIQVRGGGIFGGVSRRGSGAAST